MLGAALEGSDGIEADADSPGGGTPARGLGLRCPHLGAPRHRSSCPAPFVTPLTPLPGTIEGSAARQRPDEGVSLAGLGRACSRFRSSRHAVVINRDAVGGAWCDHALAPRR